MRNRRFRHRLGPLIVYKNDEGVYKACRNIRGVDFCKVTQLNLLKLAPGLFFLHIYNPIMFKILLQEVIWDG